MFRREHRKRMSLFTRRLRSQQAQSDSTDLRPKLPHLSVEDVFRQGYHIILREEEVQIFESFALRRQAGSTGIWEIPDSEVYDMHLPGRKSPSYLHVRRATRPRRVWRHSRPSGPCSVCRMLRRSASPILCTWSRMVFPWARRGGRNQSEAVPDSFGPLGTYL